MLLSSVLGPAYFRVDTLTIRMDTSGKDGTIRSVMSGVNPQGCKVVSFKAPSSVERGHDFLWPVHQQAPSTARSASSTARIMRTCSSPLFMGGYRTRW